MYSITFWGTPYLHLNYNFFKDLGYFRINQININISEFWPYWFVSYIAPGWFACIPIRFPVRKPSKVVSNEMETQYRSHHKSVLVLHCSAHRSNGNWKCSIKQLQFVLDHPFIVDHWYHPHNILKCLSG